MRTMLLALIALATAASSFGQYSARTLTRRIAPQVRPAPPTYQQQQQQQQQQQNPNQTQQNQTQNGQQNTAQTTPPPTYTPAPYQYAATTSSRPVDPAKAAAEKAKNDEKQFEYFKKRAEEGSDHAQYEVGIRYLAGRGTAPDEKLGREWLAKAAKNGNSPAAKKLAELGPDNEKAGDSPATATAITTDANPKTAEPKPAEIK